MDSQVFGCPNCNQPFQVLADQAGNVVQCPNCAQSVEIPASAFANPTPQASSPPPAADSQVFACGHCQGQFGVTPEMAGQQVACPHCQQPVQLPAAPTEPEVPIVEIDTRRIQKQKSAKASTPPSQTSAAPDLFAPGFATKSSTVPASTDKPSGASSSAGPTPKPTDDRVTVSRRDKSSAKKPKPDLTPPSPSSKVESKPSSRNDASSPKVDTDSAKIVVTPATAATDANVTGDQSLAEDPDASQDVDPSVSSPADDVVSEIDSISDPSDYREPIDHLLPPRFEVADPTRIRAGGSSDHKVFLPDGAGGTTQVDQRVVRIEHEGQRITLIALTPRQRLRRRIISNVIAILICIAILALAFTILSL